MSRNSAVEWCHHTFNPWWGCARVSPACEHCYAETFANWLQPGHWGRQAKRKMQSDSVWEAPLAWNATAKRRKRRERVFCASMSDVFEHLPDDHPQRGELDDARRRLWRLIERTPQLDWMLLTKRPQNVTAHEPFAGDKIALPNLWLGTTVEDERRAAERVPHLMRAPAAVRFVSCEPLLEPVDLRFWLGGMLLETRDGRWLRRGAGGIDERQLASEGGTWRWGLDWVIAGGESGNRARVSSPVWFERLADDCERAGAAFFFKQWGSWSPEALVPWPARQLVQGRTQVDGTTMVKASKKKHRAEARLKRGGRWRTFRQFPKQAQLFAA